MKSKKIILGQFYTSEEVADFMVSLSSNPKDSAVLEPSFGEGIFINSLLKAGFTNIKGYEIDEKNYRIVKERFGNKVNIECKDYLQTLREEKFDLIIGNPPYVHWNNINEEIRNKLRSDKFWKKYSNGEWDLLYAFIIWSVEKLKENGELIYIVPYNWFNSTYASSLRRYLIEKGQFEIICHFGEFKLFKDCYPNNIIFKYRKTNNENKPLIFISEFKGRKGDVKSILNYIKTEFDKIDHKEYETENEDFKIFTIPNFKNEKLWHLATPSESKFIHRIEKSTKGVILKEYLDIGVGIVSGFDEAYILNESELHQFSDEERKFIFPFIKAKNCQRYFIENGTYYILTEGIKNENELKSYPNIYARLLKYKDRLEKRYMPKNKNWWDWATVRNMNLFKRNLNKDKIFVPCIDRSLKARYSYTGDVLIIVKKDRLGRLKEDLKYILAWLNSNIINKWYRLKGAHTGHRIRYTQSYVSQIPLKLIDWDNLKEVKIYNEIVEKTSKIIEQKGNEQLEKEIDELFEHLL